MTVSSSDKTTRIPFDEYIMEICHTVSLRATCRHREQGAIIIRNKRIISTGYNGAPPGVLDCLELGYCSKEKNNICLAEGLHGESNAIITAAREGINVNGSTMYCIYSPCKSCCNMIKTAGITGVIYEEVYSGYPYGPTYLADLGITAVKLEKETEECQKI